MAIPLFVVDAFTDKPFKGNPAAVCPLEHWLDESRMQAIAAENNLSETAFLVRAGAAWELRWFTPTVEVDLCGHATVASAFVLSLQGETGPYTFLSKSGELRVREADGWFYLDFPVRKIEEIADADAVTYQVTAACGFRPLHVVRAAGICMAEFASEAQVRSINPDFARIKAMDFRGLVVTAPGETCDFVSRFFAPNVGINEDPVTGSVHCGLIPYWHGKTGKSTLQARQVSARGGELRCRLNGQRVEIGGQAVLFSRGEISL